MSEPNRVEELLKEVVRRLESLERKVDLVTQTGTSTRAAEPAENKPSGDFYQRALELLTKSLPFEDAVSQGDRALPWRSLWNRSEDRDVVAVFEKNPALKHRLNTIRQTLDAQREEAIRDSIAAYAKLVQTPSAAAPEQAAAQAARNK